jgi:uncharacterized membrane protein
MKVNIKTIIILSIILLFLDYIYISTFSNHFKYQIYKVQKHNLQLNLKAVVLSYLLIILGLYYFIIKDKRSVLDSFLLGIFVYGVYELVSKSLLLNWEYKTVLIDTIWGGLLFAITTQITYSVI